MERGPEARLERIAVGKSACRWVLVRVVELQRTGYGWTVGGREKWERMRFDVGRQWEMAVGS